MKNKQNNKSFYTLSFFLLSLINFFNQVSYSVLSLLPTHLSNLGATKSYIGFFMNIPSFELAIFILLYMKFFRNIKKTQMIVFGFIIFILSMIYMFFIYNSLILLLIIRLVSSVSYALGFVLLFSLAYDMIPMDKRIGGIAIYGISGILSAPVGSFLSEKIIIYIGVNYIFIVGAIFSFIALFLTLFLVEIKHDNFEKEDIRRFFKKIFERKLLFMSIITIIFGGAFGVFASFIPNFSKERLGVANLSIFFIAFSIIAIITRLFVFKFIDKISKKGLILFSLLAIFFSMLGIIFIQSLWQLFLIGLIYGSAHSILYPLLSTSFVNKANKDHEKTLFNNLFLISNTIGSVGLPTLLGLVGDFFGILSIFITMIGLVSLVILGSIFKKEF